MPTRSTTRIVKPAVKTAAGKTAAIKPRAATARPRAKKAYGVSAEERRRLIAEAAYFKAERRGTTSELSIYGVDAIVRRALALQRTRAAGGDAAGQGV